MTTINTKHTIKVMATAGFAYLESSENVERFLAADHHNTINGTNWSYRLIDPSLPAYLDGVIHYHFGSPKKWRIEWQPDEGWTRNGAPCHGYAG